MSDFDRTRLLELLEQLGNDDDATVLAAAREASGIVRDSDFDWDDLLLSEEDFEEEDEDEFDEEEDEDEADADEDDAGDTESAAAGEPPANMEEDARTIDRLLGSKKISDDMRNELADLKKSMANGEYDAMDSRYVHALAARLNI